MQVYRVLFHVYKIQVKFNFLFVSHVARFIERKVKYDLGLMYEFRANNSTQTVTRMAMFEKRFTLHTVKVSNEISKFQTSVWLLSKVQDGAKL